MPADPSREEKHRLEQLRRYDLLDSPPDGAINDITALAATLCGTPMAVISLVDEDRIWFKARYGDDPPQIDREPGLCASAAFADSCYEIRDALDDPRSLNNSLVRGEFGLRFYAAAPLVTANAARLGALAVLDREPRKLEEAQRAGLERLADIVVGEMELRLRLLNEMRERGELGVGERPPSDDPKIIRDDQVPNPLRLHPSPRLLGSDRGGDRLDVGAHDVLKAHASLPREAVRGKTSLRERT